MLYRTRGKVSIMPSLGAVELLLVMFLIATVALFVLLFILLFRALSSRDQTSPEEQQDESGSQR